MLRAAWIAIHSWMTPVRFYRLCVATLAFVVGVILWGALVRATGSGAGCGEHWPLCNGEMLPSLARQKTLIEFGHRLSSGLSLLLVFTVGHFAFRLFGPRHPIRRLALWSMVAIVIEALIGAALVLLRLVEHDQSLDRAVSISLHLVNTCFLVGVLTLLVWGVGRCLSSPNLELPGGRIFPPPSDHRLRGAMVLAGFIVLAALGALTALGDTLFEVGSFREGWVRDWAADAHFLERLRVLHPALAVLWLIIALPWLQSSTSVWGRRGLKGIVLNLVIGAANVLLAAPLALQLVHLLVANLIWISLVLAFVGYDIEDSVEHRGV